MRCDAMCVCAVPARVADGSAGGSARVRSGGEIVLCTLHELSVAYVCNRVCRIRLRSRVLTDDALQVPELEQQLKLAREAARVGSRKCEIASSLAHSCFR
jgi:hypothetical protein